LFVGLFRLFTPLLLNHRAKVTENLLNRGEEVIESLKKNWSGSGGEDPRQALV
jgi:hypothetical protein